jgi:hypothetical protein
MEDVRVVLRDVFERVWAADRGGDPPVLHDDTVLLDTGLDSLGYAIYVAELEDVLGYDPFTAVSEAYYPQTFGELVAFYAEHRP